MSESSHALDGVLDDLEEAASDGDVRVDRLVASFGRRGYGALLLVPALLEMSPLGGIPGVPTVLALVVALFAVQMAAGRSAMWLPGFLSRRTLSSDRLNATVEKARPHAARLDRWFHGRLGALTGRFGSRLAAGVCLVLAATVPPLEIVPFASTAPMLAIAMIGIGLLVHDGLVMLVGLVLAVVATGVVGTVLL